MAASRMISASVRAIGKKGLTPQRAPLVLTQAAISHLKVLMQDQPSMVGLRVGVKTRGCNGQSYTLEYASEKANGDDEVVQDGLKIFINSKALMHVIGTEMDYVEEKLSCGFVFNNPNIKGTCGCGESFNV